MLLLAVAPDKLKIEQLAETLPPATTLRGVIDAPCTAKSDWAWGGTTVTQPMVASKPLSWIIPSEVSRSVSAPEAVVPYTVPGWLFES